MLQYFSKRCCGQIGSYSGLWVKRSGFKTWPGHCIVFLAKTLSSHSASLHLLLWLPILLGGKILLSHFMLRKLGWAATGWAPGTDVLYRLFSFLNDSMSPHGVQQSCLLPCTLINIIWVIGPAILCVFCLWTFLTRKDDSWCFAVIMIITL